MILSFYDLKVYSAAYTFDYNYLTSSKYTAHVF